MGSRRRSGESISERCSRRTLVRLYKLIIFSASYDFYVFESASAWGLIKNCSFNVFFHPHSPKTLIIFVVPWNCRNIAVLFTASDWINYWFIMNYIRNLGPSVLFCIVLNCSEENSVKYLAYVCFKCTISVCLEFYQDHNLLSNHNIYYLACIEHYKNHSTLHTMLKYCGNIDYLLSCGVFSYFVTC